MIIEEVPAPVVEENSVLVEVYYSLISSGTEMADIAGSGESLFQKISKQPEKIKKGLDMIRTQGVSQTLSKVRSQFEFAYPTGYSCSGIVIDAGEHVRGIRIGDKVACAGAGKANHAEIVNVPRNLAIRIPDGVDIRDAASVTLGAIAMQGVRRAAPCLGDIVAVIGLGLIGQITVQLLKIAGCHVIGIDIAKSRAKLALGLGADISVDSGEEDPCAIVKRYSSGYGADMTIITAATASDEPVRQAMEMTRKKGKIVVVGDIGLHLKRKTFYEKELDLLMSTSYGPGRYDEQYEEKGHDYPYPYVRWTENRNMQEYLRQLAEGKVNLKALISGEYDLNDAPKAYQALKEGQDRPLGILLKYEQAKMDIERKIMINPVPAKKGGTINVGVIGAGDFAQGVHLPNLKKLGNLYSIYAIADKMASNAKAVAKQYSAAYATSDFKEVLRDPNVDIVIIATRHNLHAQMTIEAAKMGKGVFVEKPMALNREELNMIVTTLEKTNIPYTVGFNRRFSPFAVRARELVTDRLNPMIINYRMNAGYIPLDYWVHTDEGGGRNIGEACHIYDLFNFFTGSAVHSIEANSITPNSAQYGTNDNFVAAIKYRDGSLCSLTYTALGSSDYPKEEMEIFVDGKIIKLVDYKKLEIIGGRYKGLQTRMLNKGHLEELQIFHQYLRGAKEPIPLWQLIQAAEISFRVEEILKSSG